VRSPLPELSFPGRPCVWQDSKFGAASYGGHVILRFRSRRAGVRGWGLPTRSTTKTVIRARIRDLLRTGVLIPGWGGGLAQDGFNKNLTLNEASVGNFKTPAYLSSERAIYPEPGWARRKVIDSAFDNGQSPSIYRPLDGNRRPYSGQWNLTVERQLPSNTLLSLSYVRHQGEPTCPSALSPINVLNPLNSATTSIGPDLAVNYNDPNWSGHIRRPMAISPALRLVGPRR